MPRAAQARIDLAALRHNFQLARDVSPSSRSIPVVKANAYGHGALQIANALQDLAPAFAVACIEEALDLRESGIEQPILILQGAFTLDDVVVASECNFWLMIASENQLEVVVNTTASSAIRAWLKVDTGMHRLGIRPGDVMRCHQALVESTSVHDEVIIATHLACADDLESDFTSQQLETFQSALAGLRAPQSIANSPGLLGWEAARRDWNRPGYLLYGNSPFDHPHPIADKLRPVMTLVSAVIAIRQVEAGEFVGYGNTWQAQRPSAIATVSIGYGDGYPRHASNGTPVLVNGKRAPMAGRVSMDMITVDVTDVPDVNLGATVELWGKGLSVNEIAKHAGTIGYELLAGMPPRTPRIYEHLDERRSSNHVRTIA